MPTSNFFDVGAMAPKAPRSSEWLLRLAPCKNVQNFTCQLTGCMALGTTPESWKICKLTLLPPPWQWRLRLNSKKIRWNFAAFPRNNELRTKRAPVTCRAGWRGLFVPQWTPSSRGVDKVSSECLFQKPFSSALLGWKGKAPNVTAWNIET